MERRDWIWRSQDGRFAVHLPSRVMQKTLKLCRHADGQETGGILVGVYDVLGQTALIHTACAPPRDSRSGPTWFQRGTRGLQERLQRIWQSHHSYYLGEWHYHPCAPPWPSVTDHQQMENIATSAAYACPEPVLLIIGGNSRTMWQPYLAVYPEGQPLALTWVSHPLQRIWPEKLNS